MLPPGTASAPSPLASGWVATWPTERLAFGRFDKVGHRITGDRRQRGRNIGWDYVFVAVDDHGLVAFTKVYPDESRRSATAFLLTAYCLLP